MAPLTCKECGNQVSSTAAACPHCGAPVKVARTAQAVDLKTIMVAGVMLFFLALYFHFRDSNSTEDQTAETTTPTASTSPDQAPESDNEQSKSFPIKSGNVVKFTGPEIACNERNDMLTLKKMLIHGDKSMVLEYFSENGDGRCLVLEKTSTFEVISVDVHIKELPDYSMMKIVHATQSSMNPIWVFAENAVVQ